MSPFTTRRLLLASLLHYWRTNLAIVLGVVVGTAVIGGALIVGDSVRASLKQMTLDRLGDIDYVLTGHRFFREQLAEELAAKVADPEKNWQGPAPRIAPAIVLIGGVERKVEAATRRAGQVNVYGVDERAWGLIAPASSSPPTESGVFLNQSLAAALEAKVGDQITIWLELPSAVPRDTLLGKRDNDSQEVTVTVAAILLDGHGAPRLGFNPTQQLPMNLFVALDTLQDALDSAKIKPTRSNPFGQVARVNTLLSTEWDVDVAKKRNQFASGKGIAWGSEKTGVERANHDLWFTYQLDDLQLRIVHDEVLNCAVLESEQMLLEDQFAKAAVKYADFMKVPSSPVMVYLANWFRNPKDELAFSMYSTVAGLDILDLDEAFGPWEFVGPMPDSLGDHEVILNEWLAQDLKGQVGDEIRFGYHTVGSHGELPEEERTATVRGIVKMTGAAIDRQLTPTVKGITDADSLDDWEQPFPMDLDKVTDRDDEYWNEYRATPKAFFSLATAQKLWPSRYGSYTSVRVGIRPDQAFDQMQGDVIDARSGLEKMVLRTVNPDTLGMAFQPVKQQGLQAASGSTDFTGLFIGFSFFLILAAVILVGLLFRLAVEQRVRQWGLLAAVGLSPREIAWLMLGEGALLVLLGGVLGGFAAVEYAQLMLYGLKTWWIGAIGTRFLILDVKPLSVAIGVVAAALTSLIAVAWGLWQLRGVSLREQLPGVSECDDDGRPRSSRGVRYRAIGSLAAALAMIVGVMTGLIPQREAFSGFSWQIVVFFLAGMLCLASGLWGLSAWLQGDTALAVRGRGAMAVMRLGWRNASRRRSRSVLTAGLIASAAFVIAAVAAGQKNPAVERPDPRSGNGGFTLVAESSSPILYNLNTPDGRKTLNLTANTPAQQAALDAMRVIAFRVKPGEDASCLNLYQTRVPTILGVPGEMTQRGGFKFVGGGTDVWGTLYATPPD
ncbi:MAG TPA: FtsX-like permease family protein, partial [Planctomycetaceae bacterium]|nr:FtsX-like permease family protein [Planctomycetaceae bacterium]